MIEKLMRSNGRERSEASARRLLQYLPSLIAVAKKGILLNDFWNTKGNSSISQFIAA